MGVSTATVWTWERCDRRPDWHTARRLARVLDAPVAEVFAATGLAAPRVLHQERWHSTDVPLGLRELRRWNGLTQAQLADRLGVGAGTLAGWERGRYRPRTRTLQSLRELLPVVIDA